MKKILFLVGLVAMSIFYSSCDNELNLIAEQKDIPIVYAMLNRQDTAHFIRVEKAFVDPTIAAPVLAQDPDNLYYDNVQVQVRNNTTEEVYTFTRVDGANQGFPRKDGPFVSSPNYLYKFKFPAGQTFGDGNDLELLLNRGDEFEEVTAKTKVVSDIVIASPKLTPTNSNIRMTTRFDVRGRFVETDAFIFDIYFVFHYKEKLISETVWEDRTVEWNIGKSVEGNGPNVVVTVANGAWLNFMANALEVNTDVVRVFESIDIRIDGGGEDILKSVNLGRVNAGITSSQVTPNHTNLSEGLGIFTSRNSTTADGFALHPDSRDSLRNSVATAPLQFQ